MSCVVIYTHYYDIIQLYLYTKKNVVSDWKVAIESRRVYQNNSHLNHIADEKNSQNDHKKGFYEWEWSH